MLEDYVDEVKFSSVDTNYGKFLQYTFPTNVFIAGNG